ncbi:uncharacterized protein (UPF0335 family) [Rhodoblastus acidophilus]|nr:uncharacterized protein (UPF0335 family) [Rhodoblastus acidophilus]
MINASPPQIVAAVAAASRLVGLDSSTLGTPIAEGLMYRARYVALAALIEALPGANAKELAKRVQLTKRNALELLHSSVAKAAWWRESAVHEVADAVRQVAPDPEEAAGASVDGGHLKAFIERIERLEEEKKAIADDIRDVYAEAKGNGYDAKIMRKIIALRRLDPNLRREEEEILDLYLASLGE